MTFAICCVLLSGLLPFVAVGIAKWDRGYDNRDPRGWEESLSGRQRRAHAAHLNSFEAFPLFAAAILFAQWTLVPQYLINGLSALFVAARILYIWLYVNDHATTRSLVWMLGLASTVALLILAAIRAA